MPTRHRPAILTATATAAALSLALVSGCAALDPNQGGDTTCADYMEMPPEDQREVITTFLDEKGQSDPAGMEVTLNQESAKLYCSTVGQASDPIRNIDTG
ncbi:MULTISPECIES: hypothetical protein [unclassified Dietzia]|uniref:hypothetical protein n=1 Tax=unclassified Dietzia TaxID=2617939 RepID=UPI000D20A9A6|nr:MULTISPECIES: hypothetical protein [unclassified Dietzia]AVZ40474.1 hypothetical protein CT688_14365 [Dietzia sp. JS16-p6b]MBB1023259.1 hypothetical protein [Dietzia sp. DQ12-76]MBB1026800.1 hypothetical protein [Dietzia sp. DQ11-38-2]QGW25995.1 hypothetical protein GJR88_04562 [Dietzia sp. DQ12-45-1b]